MGGEKSGDRTYNMNQGCSGRARIPKESRRHSLQPLCFLSLPGEGRGIGATAEKPK